jgi:mannan endo-1,6-alpha-mannosidase
VGIFLHGSAVMWNQVSSYPTTPQRLQTNANETTGDTQQVWRNRTESFLKASLVFFTGNNKTVMFEAACERNDPSTQLSCNVDQRSFKAYLSRWLAATTLLAPWTVDTIMPLLRGSALAAAQSCSGGSDGVTCGNKWWVEGWDGQYGVGEQMCALEVIQSNLVGRAKGPLSGATGGTSKGDPAAGGGQDAVPEGVDADDMSPRDRQGAIALTVVLILTMVGTAW